MVRLKEKLKSCGQEPFPIANKNNRSIPEHIWAKGNIFLLETQEVCYFIFLSLQHSTQWHTGSWEAWPWSVKVESQ